MREFLPPIDREDIMELSGTIDDVTDSIEDVLLRLYMFNIRTLRPEAQAFAQVLSLIHIFICASFPRPPKQKLSATLWKGLSPPRARHPSFAPALVRCFKMCIRDRPDLFGWQCGCAAVWPARSIYQHSGLYRSNAKL